MAIFFAGVFLLSGMFPHLGMMMDFDLEKIKRGEVWRVFTFIFAPHAGGFSAFGLLFAFFAMMLSFMFSDGLEQQWGVFRTNLYVVAGYLVTVIAALILGFTLGFSPVVPGIYLGLSVFFAFATYHPKFSLMLFFVLPVQIWIMATIVGVFTMLGVLSSFAYGQFASGIFTLLALSNYIVVALCLRFSPERRELASMKRKNSSRLVTPSQSSSDVFHKCSVCGATDVSHPDDDFRTGHDGEDYCEEHLPN